MKKLLLALAALPAMAVTAQTTKKVIIEDYTGIWCQWCPEGTVVLEDLAKQHPGNLIPIANHNDNGPQTDGASASDRLEIKSGAAVPALVGLGGFPAGGIDRKLFTGESDVGVGRNKWENYFDQQAATTAIVSVGFANPKRLNATEYEVDVKVKFSAAPTQTHPLALQVYVLEDSIIASTANQLRQINAAQSSVHNGETPLTTDKHKYYHSHTLRMAVGGDWGYTDVIPAKPVVGTEYTKKVTFKIKDASVTTWPTGGWMAKNLHVVAFVAYNGSGAGDKEILNAEEISHFQFKHPTDVAEVSKSVEMLHAYPNPAKTSDLVKLEYNTVQSGKVTLNVYNAIGQLVATPYSSDEVAGMHTIQFSPSFHNVTPGTYFLHLNNGSETQISKLTLQ